MDTLSPTIFREYDIRGLVDQDLTEHAVHLVGKALGTRIREAGGRKAAVGRDARLSGERFRDAMVSALTSTGIDVLDLGVVPTPLTYFAAHTAGVDGICMITGSHNPPEYNGLKVGLGAATFHGEEIQALRRLAESGRFASGSGTVSPYDVITPYRKYVRENLRLGGRKLKVVVDAGNGTGGVIAVPILEALGVEVVPLFIDMDGRFPNHHPDPTVEKNLEHLKAKVLETKADLGIAYDGDADRVGAVDERGRVLWGDQIMILFSRALLAEEPGAAIVGEVKCSMSLYDDIAKRGGRAIMWKAGHSLIKAKMKEERALLAGEMSGHIFFAHRWFGFDDGIYSSARLVELLSRTDAPLSALLADVPRTESTPELRVDCPEDKKFEVVRRAQEFFAARYEAVTVDGVRVVFPDGWGLVRASNTQPLLVLRFEARTKERLDEIEALVRGKVAEIMREVGA
ncbi:phosphomannomutase/phosphoglucomutase [Anaeromyxobacter sp. Fw109-5]|uniref:phosphomannomutase/phosphoglucomutase n=1 Tax=Anaeromyxobacter sp. (strain Fw109-5) TaxID=404589 RepID=UPI0000ED78F1|nr:phosphomannomutase/phosphoglucomutase [Anaeromyxobacter sp. Fw109-5]ABS24384.1 Phosphomannomutase [Anaeromyxobacter sp. Fw109-5]